MECGTLNSMENKCFQNRNGNLIGTTTGKVLFNALFESKYHYKINELLINGGENERF